MTWDTVKVNWSPKNIRGDLPEEENPQRFFQGEIFNQHWFVSGYQKGFSVMLETQVARLMFHGTDSRRPLQGLSDCVHSQLEGSVFHRVFHPDSILNFFTRINNVQLKHSSKYCSRSLNSLPISEKWATISNVVACFHYLGVNVHS